MIAESPWHFQLSLPTRASMIATLYLRFFWIAERLLSLPAVSQRRSASCYAYDLCCHLSCGLLKFMKPDLDRPQLRLKFDYFADLLSVAVVAILTFELRQ